MVFSALTLPPGDDLRLWKDQGQLITDSHTSKYPYFFTHTLSFTSLWAITIFPDPSWTLFLGHWPSSSPSFLLASSFLSLSYIIRSFSTESLLLPSNISTSPIPLLEAPFFFFLTLLLPQTVFICFCFPSNSLKGELLPPPPQHHIFFWPFKADQFPPSVPSGTGSCLNVGITWGPRCFSRGPKAI